MCKLKVYLKFRFKAFNCTEWNTSVCRIMKNQKAVLETSANP